MDGITGMKGDAPSSGELRKDVGFLIASNDGVALDTVTEKIIGMKKKSTTTVMKGIDKYESYTASFICIY
jgi:uncharacterized protein (DUF362 family)